MDLMTTTRYFPVTTKVTSCMHCPKSEPSPFSYNKTCGMAYTLPESQRLFHENVQALTDSCPMAAQHKESETK